MPAFSNTHYFQSVDRFLLLELHGDSQLSSLISLLSLIFQMSVIKVMQNSYFFLSDWLNYVNNLKYTVYFIPKENTALSSLKISQSSQVKTYFKIHSWSTSPKRNFCLKTVSLNHTDCKITTISIFFLLLKKCVLGILYRELYAFLQCIYLSYFEEKKKKKKPSPNILPFYNLKFEQLTYQELEKKISKKTIIVIFI